MQEAKVFRVRMQGDQEGEVKARESRTTKLTDRDRDLLGLLVLARYLTAAQVHRLAFDGTNLSVAYRRLLKLSGNGDGGQPAFVRQTFFRTYDGTRVAVWAPTAHAIPAALARAGHLPELPKHDVGAQFLEHLVQLNQLFVALWSTAGRCPRANHALFRWTPSDRIRLTWGEYEMRLARRQQRIIQPDAVLELPTLQRRYFLECEMGTQPIRPGESDAQGATLSKASRYFQVLNCWSDDLRRTHYEVQYPDRFAPEVLFLVLNSGRAASVNAALEDWKAKHAHARRPIAMRAIPFDGAVTELRTLAGLPPRPPESTLQRRKTAATLAPAEISLFWHYLNDSLGSIKGARKVFRGLKRTDLPPYPASYEGVLGILNRLAGPARRPPA